MAERVNAFPSANAITATLSSALNWSSKDKACAFANESDCAAGSPGLTSIRITALTSGLGISFPEPT